MVDNYFLEETNMLANSDKKSEPNIGIKTSCLDNITPLISECREDVCICICSVSVSSKKLRLVYSSH